MPASVPNGRTFCRADKRAHTLPHYLAPSLMTARTSAMPEGRFPSRNDAPIGSPASDPVAAALCPPIAKHLILI